MRDSALGVEVCYVMAMFRSYSTTDYSFGKSLPLAHPESQHRTVVVQSGHI